MIDLHTHTLFSDGELLPSELVRRAEVKGYTAIALTDHVDPSNIDFILPRIVKVCKVLNRFWKIRAIPGVEITHAPVQQIKGLVRFARRHGAKVVVVHGETISEPVIPGTNRAAIEAGCDILAHPGIITKSDVELAGKRGVYLEITTRRNHSRTNKRLFKMAKKAGAKLVLDNDAHGEGDLVSRPRAIRILQGLGMTQLDIYQIFKNSEHIVKNKS
ncbi:MAG: histidinol phosphate phosphatase domain-containing protein [Candidatus Omnitrophica bacterium]|nr:histidinol phosphate phosphatase domain-containing protein [Candidatus Omnitrophota bacterium]MDD5436346.1 histidinol phosphate phosphatase domain-containing protein [Candidatus Omnitrophota bacterium]